MLRDRPWRGAAAGPVTRAAHLSQALMRFGGEGVVVVTVPWHLEPERLDAALIPEERRGGGAA